MANTGLRVGEITGLRWCDVDMENGIISVNHMGRNEKVGASTMYFRILKRRL